MQHKHKHKHAVAQCSSCAGDSACAGDGDAWSACGGGCQLPGAPRADGAEEQRGETDLVVGAEEQ